LAVSKEKDDFACMGQAEAWIGSDECRRIGFSRMLDGTNVSCASLPGCQLCDHCGQGDTLSKGLSLLFIFFSFLIHPLTDIQNLVLKEHSDPQDEDEYDNYSFSDTILLDFASVTPSLSLTSSSIKPLPLSQNLAPNLFSICPPYINEPSTSVIIDAVRHNHAVEAKAKRMKTLNDALNEVQNNCPVCWTWGRLVAPRHAFQFTRCNDSRRSVPYIKGWIDLKRFMRLEDHCWTCGFPSKLPGRPHFHGDDGAKSCTLPDFCAQMILPMGELRKWSWTVVSL